MPEVEQGLMVGFLELFVAFVGHLEVGSGRAEQQGGVVVLGLRLGEVRGELGLVRGELGNDSGVFFKNFKVIGFNYLDKYM